MLGKLGGKVQTSCVMDQNRGKWWAVTNMVMNLQVT